MDTVGRPVSAQRELKRLIDPAQQLDEHFVVACIDGVAWAYNPERKGHGLAFYCVWADPQHKGQQNWQPLENLDIAGVFEFLRRDGNALFHTWGLLQKDRGRPYDLSEHPDEGDDEIFGKNPESEFHSKPPRFPELPERVITPAEHAIARHAMRLLKEADLPHQGVNIPKVDLVKLVRLEQANE